MGNDGYAQRYDIICKFPSTAGDTFRLEFNGVNLTGPVEVHSAGEPNAWVDVRFGQAHFIAGDQ